MFGQHFVLNEEAFHTLEQIGEHIPGGFFIYKAEGNEELLYANHAVWDIFGCSTVEEFKELTGYTFRGMLHPEDYAAISESIVEQISSSQNDLDYVEYRIIRKDGQVRWIEDYGHFVQSDVYGGLYYVYISDITEKRMRQETDLATGMAVIQALSMVYRTLWLIEDVDAEHVEVTIFRDDMGTQSPAQKTDDGQLPKIDYLFLQDWYVEHLAAPDERGRMREEFRLDNMVNNTRQGIYSVSHRRLVGEMEKYYRIEMAKVDMPGGKTGIAVGFKDVDDEVRKEQQYQQTLKEALEVANASSKAKSEFLSSMSHDIRTPMNGIIGMTAIAATHLDDRERVADCLRKISDSSGHLLSLINEVLDMNKIESGRIELAEDEFDLSELIDHLLSMTRPQVLQHRHNLRVQIHDVEHEKLLGDSHRLQQVLVNLLSNAIKYTADGGEITLSITERPTKLSGTGCFEFVFEDNGFGMTKEFQEHLFEPFTRAEDGRTSRIQGTGLGLAITRNIVRMMGGDILVDSAYGVGSKFTVTVYLKYQEEGEIDYNSFTDLTVLVIDDDPQSCESACGILNDIGMISEWVLSGRSAIDRVMLRHEQSRDFYAIIIDWKMPDMDGVEITRRIRKMVGEDVPIIIFSAYDWTDIEDEARAAGANLFISKPLFRTKLVHLFQSIVNGEAEHNASTPLKSLEELELAGHRILLAEDHLINAEIAKNVFGMTGLAVDWVENGREAVEKMNSVPDGYYDMIFMDIQMPVMNGYEAAKTIRADGRNYLQQIPIIAMTANAFTDDILDAKNAGMNGHIAKPIDFGELAKTLQTWIGTE